MAPADSQSRQAQRQHSQCCPSRQAGRSSAGRLPTAVNCLFRLCGLPGPHRRPQYRVHDREVGGGPLVLSYPPASKGSWIFAVREFSGGRQTGETDDWILLASNQSLSPPCPARAAAARTLQRRCRISVVSFVYLLEVLSVLCSAVRIRNRKSGHHCTWAVH